MLRAANISRSQTAAFSLHLLTKRWITANTKSAAAITSSTSSTTTTTISHLKADQTVKQTINSPTMMYAGPGPLGSRSGGGGKIAKALFYSLALGLTGTIVYAEYEDGPFRKQIESNIPYSSELFSSIDQYLDPVLGRQRPSKDPNQNAIPELGIVKETKTVESSTQKKDEPLKPVIDVKNEKKPVNNTVSQPPSRLPDPKKVKEKIEQATDQAKTVVATVQETLPDPKVVKKNLEDAKNKAEEKVKETISSTKAAAETALSQVKDSAVQQQELLKEKLQTLQQDLQRLTTPLSQQIDEATKAAQEHINHMKTLIESSQIPTAENELWKQAEVLQEKAKSAHDQVAALLTEWKSKLIDYSKMTDGQIHPDEKKIDEKFKELEKEFTTSNFVRNFRSYIDEAAQAFQKEIETMFPSLVGKSPAQLTTDDFQALLLHAHRRIVKLQNEIARMKIKETDSVKAAIDVARAELDEIVENQVKERVLKVTSKLSEQMEAFEKTLRNRFDDQLRHELVLQHQALTQYLADVLSRQYQEWTREYEEQLENETIKVQLNLQHRLKNTFDRLHAIEKAIENNHQSQQRARQAQQLWIQAQNLLHQIVQGTTNEADLENLGRIIPDEKFVQILLNELKGDDLCETNEELLRERFRNVSKLCRRFALVDEQHNSLISFLLSYLQSLVIIQKRDESILKDDAIDLNQLDTFKILNYVQTYLEHNQWYNALRLMQLLTGEPKNVAQSWINDTRAYLAKKQTSELLEAYSNSIGLGTLPRKA